MVTLYVSESLVLFGSLLFATLRIAREPSESTYNTSISYELYALLAAALCYMAHTYTTFSDCATPLPGKPPPPQNTHPQPHAKRKPEADDKFGFIWMSVPKNYRLGHRAALQPFSEPTRAPPVAALVRARYNLLSLSILTSAVLLGHVCASRWLEERYVAAAASSVVSTATEGERRSVPRSEGLRGLYFILFTLSVSAAALIFRLVLERLGTGFGQHLSPFDVVVGALFYQFTLYVALRMAHRGFTLGELGLVCFGGTAVFMEFLNITMARMWPITTPYVKTYRLPTPLIVFRQPSSQAPSSRAFSSSRFSASRATQRRPPRAASGAPRAASALGALLIVLGPLGLWTRWCLGGRDPWLWTIRWVVGRRRRAVLLVYWGALGGVSVAGWTRQLARSRRAAGGVGAGGEATPTSALFAASGEFLDRAPTLRLNARRKFFHALVVVMFLPGVAFDPAFTHLAFSVAFALFVFAEYIRYFAIYPLGAAVHRFMAEFLDTKDGGTAILSHFYLLTGCAGALWLEGPSRLLQFTGVLVLGIGDALASIVGKRHGRHAWSPTTPKTLEGSAAFAASIVASAWALRVCGLAEPFSTPSYVLVVALAAVLEALSDQNDNLTLPLYTWSALTLVGVS
ncbi:hypothetical protein B0H13DRAFT_2232058 [Mycena leptocephala]|nr:hypothetical protein B0H13DRAFT_2232058 [Mycena leptocephala]